MFRRKKNMTQLTIELKVDIKDQDIDDIMVTALEGGINYWCGRVRPFNNDYKGGDYASDVISRGGSLILTDVEDEDETWELTKKKFLSGLSKFLVRNSEPVMDDNTLDCGMIDAEGADMIIQYALFNEIVFG